MTYAASLAVLDFDFDFRLPTFDFQLAFVILSAFLLAREDLCISTLTFNL
jgi:hypothetical protein